MGWLSESIVTEELRGNLRVAGIEDDGSGRDGKKGICANALKGLVAVVPSVVEKEQGKPFCSP